MTCGDLDLNGYALGELPPGEREGAERHVAECADCETEVERLMLTLAALKSVPAPEPTQRIAFVSDKVFERKWYQRLWPAGPGWGFAAASLLAGSILAHGWMMRPVAMVAGTSAAAPVVQPVADPAAMERRVAEALESRVNTAVAKAVEQARQEQMREVRYLVSQTEDRLKADRAEDLVQIDDAFRALSSQLRPLYVAANSRGGERP